MQINSNIIFKFNGAFLNGQGNTKGKISTTQVKQYQENGISQPYVSAQAYRKWMRNHIAESQNSFDYYSRLSRNKTKKEYEKLIHVEGDPVKYLEDDMMGHSKPLINNILDPNEERLSIASTNRHSPLGVTCITILNDGLKNIHPIEGFVHLASDTPLPYRIEFSNGIFQSTVNLDVNRIGTFENKNDIYELDNFMVERYLESGEITEFSSEPNKIFQLNNLSDRKIQACESYFDMIFNTYPDVKISQFATDISPRLLVSAILEDASGLISNTVKFESDGDLVFNIEHIKNVIAKRGHKLKSDLYVGYRSGLFGEKGEQDLLSFDGKLLEHKNGSLEMHVTSPGDVRDKLLQQIGEELR